MGWGDRRRMAAGAGVLLGILCGGARADGCSKPMTLATGEWAPYSYHDAQGRFTGIDTEMVRAIFKEAGCRLVERSPMPASRNLTLFERGQIDLMMGASMTPQRRKLAHFSVPYRDEVVGLFSLAETGGRYLGLRSFDDVIASKLTLLAPRVGWYGPDYDRHMNALLANKRLYQFTDFAQGIRMLAAGRGTFMLGDASGVEDAAARQGVKVQPLPFWLVEDKVHLMFNRASVSEADVRRIDGAILRLQRRGAFERIRAGFNG